MSVLDIMKERYSAREYLDRKVEKEKIDIILEAARVAPTGCNFQPFKIVVIESEEGLKRLKNCVSRDFAPPLAFLVFADNDKVWTRKYDGKKIGDIDAAIVTDHMMLAATELGLGSVWICNFKPEEVKKNFDIGDNFTPVNLLYVGYASCEKKSSIRHDKERKSIEDITVYM